MILISIVFIPNAKAESSRPGLLEDNYQYEERIKRDRSPYTHSDSLLKDNRYNKLRTYPRTKSDRGLLQDRKGRYDSRGIRY